ncbi:hypothetical protein CIB48_g2585 [Xylaria polymorpha]|nr:hypothetical protein CIB48_g2585 [Xylaria polymorpha]
MFQRVATYALKMADRTQLVYQRDGERLRHTAKILSVVPVSALTAPDQALVKDASDVEHAIITDSTIFHVQGGGQLSDTGTMTSSDEAATAKADSTFEVKSELQQHVDAEKRNLHSRLHTAGHVMSLAIHALCREGVLPPLTEVKASHYPDSAAVVFNGSIDGKHKDAIQAKTDEFVRSASPVKIHWWPMEELLAKCHGTGEGFALPEGETLGRVVEMEGLGSYPCGGTHVQDCSQVGKIEVKKIARSKGTKGWGLSISFSGHRSLIDDIATGMLVLRVRDRRSDQVYFRTVQMQVPGVSSQPPENGIRSGIDVREVMVKGSAHFLVHSVCSAPASHSIVPAHSPNALKESISHSASPVRRAVVRIRIRQKRLVAPREEHKYYDFVRVALELSCGDSQGFCAK